MASRYPAGTADGAPKEYPILGTGHQSGLPAQVCCPAAGRAQASAAPVLERIESVFYSSPVSKDDGDRLTAGADRGHRPAACTRAGADRR
jgi:hypothetical protein